MKKKFGFHIKKQPEDVTDVIVDDIIDELQETQDPMEEMKTKIRIHKMRFWRRVAIVVFLLIVILVGTYLYIRYETFSGTAIVTVLENTKNETSQYYEYGKGYLRCSRDGIVYLKMDGTEVWNQPCQIRNPIIDICGDTVAIGDRGGTDIFVCQTNGLKGEIKTTMPIQKITVSKQGIVASVLKNEKSQKIFCYDAKGNILVEHNTSLKSTGYPLDVELSDDGETMIVSYLALEGAGVSSEVVYYNFGELGKESADHEIYKATYPGTVVPSVDFLDNKTSVLMGDDKIVYQNGLQRIKPISTISLKKELKSITHNEYGVACIVKGSGKGENEFVVYDECGKVILTQKFEGEYHHIKLTKDQVILYEGNRCMIWSHAGVCKYKGEMDVPIMEIIPLRGLNKYMVLNADGMHEVRLTK